MNKTFIILGVGVAIGLLLAPRKGSETLQRLRNKINDMKGEAEDQVNDLMDEGKYAVKQGKRKVADAMM